MINILILSAGTRNKVVQYFRKELAGRGKVYATDCSELAPAVYEADEAMLVPRMTDPGYLETILDICREKKITGVFSLIDPELTLLAEHRRNFLRWEPLRSFLLRKRWLFLLINIRCTLS